MSTRLDSWLLGLQPFLRVTFSVPGEIRKHHLSSGAFQLKGAALVLLFQKVRPSYLD